MYVRHSTVVYRAPDREIHALYDADGELAGMPPELLVEGFASLRLRTFPVQVRYGLIWVFFGAEERAASTPMPEIPELEGPDAWACVPIDFTWRAHHSMIIDNVSDFTHAYLHRKYQPFSNDSKLTKLETVGDKVYLSYRATALSKMQEYMAVLPVQWFYVEKEMSGPR